MITYFLAGVGTLRAEYGASLSALSCRAAQTACRSRNAGNSEPADRDQQAKDNAEQGASSRPKHTTCQAGTVPLMPASRPALAAESAGIVRDPSQIVTHEYQTKE